MDIRIYKCQITCESLQKSSKCQNFLRVWHLDIFRADQLKKPPCRSEAVGAIIKVLIVFHLPSVFPGRKCEILKLKYVIKSKVSISG